MSKAVSNTSLDRANPQPGDLGETPSAVLSDAARVTTLDRQESSQALKDSEVRYRRLFESAKDGILILDAKTGYITDVNPASLELLECSREELLGKTLWEIGLFKDINASKAAFLELKSKRYVRYEDLTLQTAGGVSSSVEFVGNVYNVNRKKVIQCNLRDVTARRYAEQSEQQLRQAQKMETVGQLAGGIAHDFNNHLTVILGYCEMLEQRVDLSFPTRKMVEEIRNAGMSAKELTRHLLAFGRRQAAHVGPLDLNASLNHLQPMLNRLIGEEIELVFLLGSNLGAINADPIQIEQVLMNLAINARDAMPEGGRINIETANLNIDPSNHGAVSSGQEHSLKPGSYVMLTLRDTGVGMDQETQSRIFEPFFSTKGVGKGTGLGLSTVFAIVRQSDGAISVQSEPGVGTEFKIYFPRSEESVTMPQVQKPGSAVPGGSETILLVDDATNLRKLTRQLLQECGYTVIDSGDPLEAIQAASVHQGLLSLMISDVVMPGLSGPALAQKLAVSRPEMRVLFTSGYADDEVVRHGIVGSSFAFLEKPYTRDDLVRKVREILDLPQDQAA